MKTILTLFFCLATVIAFSQTASITAGHEIKASATPTTEKKLTAADSVTSLAAFEPSTKKQLADIESKIQDLQKQFEDLAKEKNTTLKTAWGIYCDKNKIDQGKVTVKGVTKEGITIQTLK